MRERDPWLEYWFGRAWIFVRSAARPPGARARATTRSAPPAICAARRSRSARSSPATTTSGRISRRSIAGCPNSNALLGAGHVGGARSRKRAARARRLRDRAPVPPAGGPAARDRARGVSTSCIDGEDDVNVRMMAASTLFNYLNWKTKGDAAAGARRAHRADRRAARRDAADAGVVAHAPLVLALHQRPLRRVGGGDRRSARDRRALRARGVPVRDRPRGGLRAHQQGRLRGREGAAARRWSSGCRRPPHGLGVLPSSALDARAARSDTSAPRCRTPSGRVDARPETGLPVAADAALPRAPRAHAASRRAIAKAACAPSTRRSRAASGRRAADLRAAARAGRDRRRHRRRATPQRARAAPRARCSPTTARAGRLVFLRNRPDLAARLANFALEHGIEAEFVRTLIEHNALAAPADAGPAWPFRLRVRALGGFELVRDGAADALHRQGAAAAARPAEAAGRAGRRRRRQPAADGGAVAGRRRRGGEDIVRHDALPPAQAARRRQCARARGRQAVARAQRSRGPTCGRSRRRSTPRNALGDGDAPDASPPRVGAPPARRLSGPAARRRGERVDREAARRAARALRAHADAPGRAARARRATGRPPSTSTGAASKPTTLPSRSIAASCARWPRPAIRPRRSTPFGAAASSCRSCSGSSRPPKPSGCTGKSSPAARRRARLTPQ